MKIGVLTSSRADYGIYFPLLKEMKKDPFFKLQLLVFGTHLAEKFGYTAKQIENDGFEINYKFNTAPENDSPAAIIKSMSNTISIFAELWNNKSFDLIIALGDRYEMFAAVTSTVPFNIPVAHIHGGETTLGAIDNSFRNSITSMSKIHFTSSEEYKRRVIEIIGKENYAYNVGALSIDMLKNMIFLSKKEFYEKYDIDLNKPTVLFTFHPETVSYEHNEDYIKELVSVLRDIKNYQIVITMPNADTKGNLIRDYLNTFLKENSYAIGIESFGSLGYLSCMKHCSFMLGNTSSGFIEASFFSKPVINVGSRQTGRIITPNIYSCPIEKDKIEKGIEWAQNYKQKNFTDIYGNGNASSNIIKIIKDLFTNSISL